MKGTHKTCGWRVCLSLLAVSVGVMGSEAAIGIFDTSQDIGTPGWAGSAKFEGGVYTVEGSGDDIWNNADNFHFLYKEVSGNFSFKANVTIDPYESANDWSKAALMVRDSTEPGSAHYDVLVRGLDSQADAQWRAAADGASGSSALTADQNGDLEIVRLGNTFSMYMVNQAGKRVLFNTTNVPMTDPVYVGLAVTSHEDGVLSRGEYKNVELTPINYEISRILPSSDFTPGQTVSVQLKANIATGQTADLTVTETPPAGWAVSNIQASAGTANSSGGNIVWTLAGASGEATLTYDVAAPANAATASWNGTVNGAGLDLSITGSAGMKNADLTTVYFIGGLGAGSTRNSVYTDLLGAGLSMLDENDQPITIPGLGYTVSYIDENADSPQEGSSYSVVIAHESVTSANVAQYVNQPVPYLAIEQILAAGRTDRDGSIWFSPASGVTTGTDGEYQFVIINNTHPITSRYQVDQTFDITRSTDAQVAGITEENLAPGATPLAQTGTENGPLRYSLVVADKGATGFVGDAGAAIPAGADPAPERRAFLGFHERTQIYSNDVTTGPESISITKEATILFQRVVQWLVGAPVTADGTPAGTDVREWSLY